jgi:hypothetical protein
MTKLSELTYSMSKQNFLAKKRQLDGFVFWREENGEIIIKFATKKLESYFVK